MANRIVRNITIFLATLILGCLNTNAYAGNEVQCERPGKLFSPSKILLLEDTERDKWQKPEEILNALGIGKGQVVADIGAGSGYLTAQLSERVGETGIVYAVDVQQEMLDYIKKRIQEKDMKNVVPILNTMYDPKLPEGSLDIAILLSVYHEMENPIEFMKSLKSALKPHGKVAIMEFSDESPIGPPLKIRLPESLVMNELKQAGFALSQRHTFLLPYQYFLVFTLL
jgi:ubiquinone/menaquinone biosynthesis C-methylase UbiE